MPRQISSSFKPKLSTVFRSNLTTPAGQLNRLLGGQLHTTDPQQLTAAKNNADLVISRAIAQIDTARSSILRTTLLNLRDKRKAVHDSVQQRLRALSPRSPEQVLTDFGSRLSKPSVDPRITPAGLVIRASKMPDDAAVKQ